MSVKDIQQQISDKYVRPNARRKRRRPHNERVKKTDYRGKAAVRDDFLDLMGR